MESDVVARTRQSDTGGAREIEAAQLQELLLDDLLDEMDAEEERQVQAAAAMVSRSAPPPGQSMMNQARWGALGRQ